MPLTVGGALLGEHFRGVLDTLTTDDHGALLERLDVTRIFEGALVFGHHGRGATGVGGRKIDRPDQLKVALGLHAIHQDRTGHAAPADQANETGGEFYGDTLSFKGREAFEPGSSSRLCTTNQAGSALDRRGFDGGLHWRGQTEADVLAGHRGGTRSGPERPLQTIQISTLMP